MLLNNSSETILLRAKDGLTCMFAFKIELYKREVKGFLIYRMFVTKHFKSSALIKLASWNKALSTFYNQDQTYCHWQHREYLLNAVLNNYIFFVRFKCI